MTTTHTLLTSGDAAILLGLSRVRVWQLVSEGKLKRFTTTRAGLLFRHEDVIRLREQRRAARRRVKQTPV